MRDSWPIGTRVRFLKLAEVGDPKYKTPTWKEYEECLLKDVSLPVYWECEGMIVGWPLQVGKSLRLDCTSQNNEEACVDLQTSTVQAIRGEHENMVEFDTLNSTYILVRLERENVDT